MEKPKLVKISGRKPQEYSDEFRIKRMVEHQNGIRNEISELLQASHINPDVASDVIYQIIMMLIRINDLVKYENRL